MILARDEPVQEQVSPLSPYVSGVAGLVDCPSRSIDGGVSMLSAIEIQFPTTITDLEISSMIGHSVGRVPSS